MFDFDVVTGPTNPTRPAKPGAPPAVAPLTLPAPPPATGLAKGGRKLQGMMAGAVKWRFVAFNDEEIVALKEFLDAREP